MHEPYLLRLADRLAGGLVIDDERRAGHRRFLLAAQREDGGFPGREGDSDLYYTGFALRGLVLLDGTIEEPVRDGIHGFLASHDPQRLHVVDLVSWLYAAVVLQLAGGDALLDPSDTERIDRIAAKLESVRRDDGGYAKSDEGALGSTYQSFLTVLAYELIGRDVPRPNALIQFLYDRQRDDGGFVEIAPMKRSGTNPTAAAVALLVTLGGMDDELRDDVSEFLQEVRGDEGGFRANTRIPFSDGLSTFTGLLTVLDLKLEGLVDLGRIQAWLTHPEHGLELPNGGFRGASWDDAADAEYTFYGLGLLGLLGSVS